MLGAGVKGGDRVERQIVHELLVETDSGARVSLEHLRQPNSKLQPQCSCSSVMVF